LGKWVLEGENSRAEGMGKMEEVGEGSDTM